MKKLTSSSFLHLHFLICVKCRNCQVIYTVFHRLTDKKIGIEITRVLCVTVRGTTAEPLLNLSELNKESVDEHTFNINSIQIWMSFY